jgi:phosphatidylserine/phosphatidylglycerophosphate/cardiolipin synthase-like enzyme
MPKFIKFSFKKIKKYRKKILIIFTLSVVLILFLILVSYKFSIKTTDDLILKPKEEIVINRNLDSLISFNDKEGYENFINTINETVDSAQKSIDIAIYSMNDSELISLLEKKHSEGIAINIIVPKSKNDTHEKIFEGKDFNIKTLGINNFGSDVDSLMHHKFIIVDKFEKNQALLFSSANLTEIQNIYDPNFLLKTTEPEIIKTFAEEFELLKQNKTSIRKLRDKNYSPFAKQIIFSNSFLEIWFSPGYKNNSVKTRMLDLIENAENSIYILSWQLNDFDIFKALSKKAHEGIEIIIISDDYYLWSKNSIVKEMFYLQQKINKNIEIIGDSFNSILIQEGFTENKYDLIKDFNSFLHHHTMIVDQKILVFGTNNWGKNGFYHNDESIMITNDNYLVNSYLDYFNILKEKIKARDVEFLIKDNTLILQKPNEKALNFIIYKEKSFPDTAGEICQKGSLIQQGTEIKLNKDCINNQTKIFLYESDGTLFSSDYLFKKELN